MSVQKKKLTFTNHDGIELAGLLELPEQPIAFALFAHCFTCTKDIVSASRIAKGLADKGIAVLRFDFTGLGNSDGDFSNSNFSANLDDLHSAANYLREHYQAPDFLIGHSLGGTAVLAAAENIPETKAIVTIGAPAEPSHVLKQFTDNIDEIVAKGSKQVDLAGRPFTIKKQFIDDLQSYTLAERINNLKKPLLIFHSPLDTTVSINQAKIIYNAAKHPKSFISLDKADHLLTSKHDAEYVATTIQAWVQRYLSINNKINSSEKPVPSGQVVVEEKNHAFLRNIITESHQFPSDEPVRVGGSNLGPTPYDLLLASLGSCTSMTLRMYANQKKLNVTKIDIQLRHDRIHNEDCQNCIDGKFVQDVIYRELTIEGDLTEQQRQRMLEIADRCPVHRTLHNEIDIQTKLV
ncbi:bifunctional alpha/beta hydrolase/OsmC family protein [Vibrio sp. CK2-1]|uniref:bifunctional alpha/beta hydrolase/OsmC family protein n=1 Tax=Vibrio sp. CK2-1 TaxID=2912249 RepID=UPI001F450D32|nr:bifunctional alpha/beta hydrolase/OsmC family protein [Vibrio sp. CK2-1]MCF7354936.1 bifunctional alpha/beta hydrolase/OsmC family protein [Vibrio sp. CK2-1]